MNICQKKKIGEKNSALTVLVAGTGLYTNFKNTVSQTTKNERRR